MIGCLGEALIDFISGKEEEGKDPFFHYFSGGSTLNAATAAARLGSDVTFLGKLSQDMFGQKMKAYFQKNNVNILPHLTDVPENSMIGFASIDAEGAASYVFYTSETTVTSFSSDEIVEAMNQIDSLDYLLIGSVSAGLETSGNHILNALKQVKSLPCVFFDPNVRPTVIDDFEKYLARMKELAGLSTIIKLSHEDLEYLYPGVATDEALQLLFTGKTEAVILTLGRDGLRWVDQEGRTVEVPAIDNVIVDTVGAGDTVSGAVLTFLSEAGVVHAKDLTGEKIRDMLQFAVEAAAVTTSRKGANPPMRSEVGSVR